MSEYYNKEDVLSALEKIPVVTQDEREYAEWLRAPWYCDTDESRHVQCSSCKTMFWDYFKQFAYCPICGKLMRNKTI